MWGYVGKFSEFCLYQQLLAFKRFCIETTLSDILKTKNATKFIKIILESTDKVLLSTYNLAAPTRPIFLGRWVLSTSWNLDCYKFCYILKKLQS